MSKKVKIKVYDVDEVPEEIPEDVHVEVAEPVEETSQSIHIDVEEIKNEESEDVHVNVGEEESIQFRKSKKEDKKIRFRRNRRLHVNDDVRDRLNEELENVIDRAKRGKEKIESHERFERISDFGRDIVDDVFYGASDVYNRTKYNKNKSKGREIVVEKKE